jgi:Ni/Co efflux regulator RcnB
MKRFLKSSIAAGLALSLAGAPLAMAQQEQHGPPASQHAESHGPAPGAMQHVTAQHETMQRPAVSHPPMQMTHEASRPAPGPMQHQAMSGGHAWHSGEHYSGSRHYVSNWSSYHLRQPPHGYEWVQDGSQFVLVAVATGIITDVILNATGQ